MVASQLQLARAGRNWIRLLIMVTADSPLIRVKLPQRQIGRRKAQVYSKKLLTSQQRLAACWDSSLALARKVLQVFFIAAAALLAAVALIFILWPNSPNIDDFDGTSAYVNGRLWTKIVSENTGGIGLVDTGTSTSILNSEFINRSERLNHRDLETRFNTSSIETFLSKPLNILGLDFLASPAFLAKGKTSVVGNDFIFSQPSVLFSARYGIRFGHFDRDEFDYCGTITLDYAGRDTGSGIQALYFNIVIDGTLQKVLFDTGRDTFLEATGLLPLDPNSRAPTGLDISSNSLGQSRIEWFASRTVNLEIGDQKGAKRIRHFYENSSPNAAFVLGSRFLVAYDVYVDLKLGRFCLRQTTTTGSGDTILN